MVARFMMRLVGLDDEGRSNLGGVLSLAFVFDVSMETGVVIGSVSHLLDPAVWKLDSVAARHSLAVTGLLLLEGGPVVRILHPVGEAVRLGGGLVSLVVIMTVGVDGGGEGSEGHDGENGNTQETHVVCCS